MIPHLPPEIVIRIASYLTDSDYINLALANKWLYNLLSSFKRELNLFSGYVPDLNPLKTFLSLSTKSIINSLNFGQCYWLDSIPLQQLIISLSPSLKSLHIHGTKLSNLQLSTILKDCLTLTELSVSFSHEDSSFWLNGSRPIISQTNFKAVNAECIFFNQQKNLKKITCLSLYGNIYSFFELVMFLSFCEDVESVHFELNAAIDSGDLFEVEEIEKIENAFSVWPFPKFKSLKRVTARLSNGNITSNTFLANCIENIIGLQAPDLKNKFDILWIPHLFVGKTIPSLNPDATAFLTNEVSDDLMIHQGLESLCLRPEGKFGRSSFSTILRDAISKFPDLKLISCPYNSQDFVEFAGTHPDLRVIQFQSENFHDPAGPELAEGLGHLKNLENFSIEPRYFTDYRKPKQKDSVDSLSLMVVELSETCSLLNEVEIGIYYGSKTWNGRVEHICPVSCSALEKISGCSNLERLTLANLLVDSYSFLSLILSECKRLKSLRITNILSKDHQSMGSMVIEELKKGLSISKHLEYFRWEIGTSMNVPYKSDTFISMVDGAHLIDTLKQCPSLRRISIIGDYTFRLDLKSIGAVNWPLLVLACVISPTVNWEDCNTQINSDHPGFQCFLGSKRSEAAAVLTPFHYQEMVRFEPSVAKMPYSS